MARKESYYDWVTNEIEGEMGHYLCETDEAKVALEEIGAAVSRCDEPDEVGLAIVATVESLGDSGELALALIENLRAFVLDDPCLTDGPYLTYYAAEQYFRRQLPSEGFRWVVDAVVRRVDESDDEFLARLQGVSELLTPPEFELEEGERGIVRLVAD